MKYRNRLFMIEKNYELTSTVEVNPDASLDMNSLVKDIKKRNKEKTMSHGENISNCIFNFFPELYDKRKHTDNQILSTRVGHINHGHSQSSIFGMVLNKEKKQVTNRSESILTYNSHGNNYNLSGEGINKNVRYSDTSALDNDAGSKTQDNDINKSQPLVIQPKQEILSQHVDSRQHEIKSRSEISSIVERIHQLTANSLIENTRTQRQALNINYQFSRWSGDHSVKVHIPVHSHRADNLTLQPSDIRAADMLSRQIGNLNGYVTEVLQPQSYDEDDAEWRKLAQRWEDEQE